MTAESDSLDAINVTLGSILDTLNGILAQLTAAQNAFGESSSQTLGENIQDLRDDTREGVERGKELLRQRGVST